MIGQLETRSSSQIILIITFFSHRCTTLLPQQIVPKFWAKTILLGQHKISSLSNKLAAVEGIHKFAHMVGIVVVLVHST